MRTVRRTSRTISMRPSLTAAIATLLALGGFALPLARADVLTVDDDGPADHATLQAAVDAALAGDVILVHPGDYAGCLLDGKPLVVAAAVAGEDNRPHVLSGLEVRALATTQTVLLAGLDVDGATATLPPAAAADALLVVDCDGSVRVADCRLTGFPEGTHTGATPAGLCARDSGDVVLTGCTLTGAVGALGSPAGDGGPGLAVDGASVAAWDCTLQGGEGGGYFEFFIDSGDGGPGVDVAGGRAVLEGCDAQGGRGGDSAIVWSTGGAGVAVHAEAEAFLRATSTTGGLGGVLFNPFGSAPGPSGQPTVVAGSLTTLAGAPTPLAANGSVFASGDPLVLTSAGSGVLLVGLDGTNVLLTGWSAPLAVTPLLIVPMGSFPLGLDVPALPASVEGLLVHLQLARGTHELSAPLVLSLVPALP